MPLQVMSAARLGEAGLHRLMSSVVTEMESLPSWEALYSRCIG